MVGIPVVTPVAFNLGFNVGLSRVDVPGSINDLEIWYDAADLSTLTLDGTNNVAQWEDKSGNGVNASQATQANKPVYNVSTFGGLPSLRFDGNDFMTFDGSSLASKDLTIFAAIQRVGVVTIQNPIIGGQTRSVGQNLIFYYIGDTAFSIDTFGAGIGYTIPGYSSPTPVLHTGIASSTNGQFLYENGALEASDGTRTQILSAFGGAALGRFLTGTGNSFFNGDMAEIIIYTRELSTAEREKVENYLLAKWRIS